MNKSHRHKRRTQKTQQQQQQQQQTDRHEHETEIKPNRQKDISSITAKWKLGREQQSEASWDRIKWKMGQKKKPSSAKLEMNKTRCSKWVGGEKKGGRAGVRTSCKVRLQNKTNFFRLARNEGRAQAEAGEWQCRWCLAISGEGGKWAATQP